MTLTIISQGGIGIEKTKEKEKVTQPKSERKIFKKIIAKEWRGIKYG